MLFLCNLPPFPAFADEVGPAGKGSSAPAVRTSHGWAAMSGSDLKVPLDVWSRAAAGMQEFDLLCADLGIEHRLAPPQHPQTNGMAKRFNGRIEDKLQPHQFRSGGELELTLHRYVVLYNQQLPQSAKGSRTPVQAMKEWHKVKPELFRKQPCHLPVCDS